MLEVPTAKTCKICGESKPLSDFYKNKRGYFSPYCKPCAIAKFGRWVKDHKERQKENLKSWHERNRGYRKAWDEKNPGYNKEYLQRPHRKAYHKEHSLKARLKSYGLNKAVYEAMFDQQQGQCAICKKPIILYGKFTHIDHDHKTGLVRGLLCICCNQGLGQFKDSPTFLNAAVQYLCS